MAETAPLNDKNTHKKSNGAMIIMRRRVIKHAF
jgi:hypothetical protein